ncbi:UbiA-like protein EboC [Parapedobacter lycopersici]|uniref:UbiA-like protein EboC n=1 Tax=Parapedobacter lycopersici TaxID=1864939 RepID=UPI00214DCC6B|nr:UbiA-like protein EboC [Parapedobacter lycopersici]
MKWRAYLTLMRPANVVTAISDVMAGTAVSALYFAGWNGQLDLQALLLLVVSTIGLYGGGVIFNDIFDARLDAVERPERPIPSGRVPLNRAMIFGTAWFAVGVFSAAAVSLLSGAIAVSIVLMCLLYDKWAKHHVVTGPIAMGMCRGLNLLLGMSLLAGVLPVVWWLAVIPVIYIAAITVVSRGEVHGGQRAPLLFAALLYAAVIGLIIYFGLWKGAAWFGWLILLIFAFTIYAPLVKAIRTKAPLDIRKSVKYGVLALIFMNAIWVAAAGMWGLTVVVLSLFPISIWLSKMFSVT